MDYVADLHLHSKYSRAVSKDMVLPIMQEWAIRKGINILTTGDWTHPLWFREIKNQLEEKSEGLFKLKAQSEKRKATTQNGKLTRDPYFLLSVEVSSIYSQGGKLRRIHNLIFAPSFETADKINKELLRRGCNLMSDGRPIFGISAEHLLELVLTIDRRAIIVPCHAWTPWFSLYGSNSGFDSIDECFGKYAEYIYAVETGLSSDPEMNWRIEELDTRSLLSFSDAHSPAKMAREATVFVTNKNRISNSQFPIPNEKGELSYHDIVRAIKRDPKGILKIGYTIEFYPEEGKYHYNGHRNCKVVQTPQETKENGTVCPVCKRSITVGVMQRVEELALRQENEKLKTEVDELGVKWHHHIVDKHPPFVKLVPLLEIIAEAMDSTVASGKVKQNFIDICHHFGSELQVLLKTPVDEIQKFALPRVAEGIKKVRTGDIVIAPGFDGEFGKVKIWRENQKSHKKTKESQSSQGQMGLF